MLVLFPEDMDIERNLKLEERLDLYMPPGADWRTAITQTKNRGRAIRELYQRGMRQLLGLHVGEPKAIRAHGREIYKLLYASPHQLGLKVWDDCRRESPEGQIELYIP